MVSADEFTKAQQNLRSNSGDVASKFIVVSYYLEQQRFFYARSYLKDLIDKLTQEQLVILFHLLHKEILRLKSSDYHYGNSLIEEDMGYFISLLQKLHEKKDKGAESWLSPQGDGVKTLTKWLEQCPQVMKRLGEMYYYGQFGVTKNCEATLAWLLKSHESIRDSTVANLIGCVYDEQKKYELSIKYFKIASDAGNGIGSYNLGLYYINGQSVPKNLTEASRYFEAATRQFARESPWYAKAEYQLGKTYQLLQQEKSYSYGINYQAFCTQHYKIAADCNHDLAAYELACIYQAEKNDREAEKYFKIAADQKHAIACLSLSKLYKIQNKQGEAGRYLQKAAEAGNAEALYTLGCEQESKQQYDQAFRSIYSAYQKNYALAKQKLETQRTTLSGYFTLYKLLAQADQNFETVFNAMQPYLILQRNLGYYFFNAQLLLDALDRTVDAATREAPFQRWEFLGDSVLSCVVRDYLVQKCPREWLTGDLEYASQSVVSNTTVLPQIATSLKLSELLKLDVSERSNHITDKMQVDALEALFGAMSRDAAGAQGRVTSIIQRLWQPWLERALSEQPRSVRQRASSAAAAPARVAASAAPQKAHPPAAAHLPDSGRLSPVTQRVFSGLGGNVELKQFEETVSRMSDVNRRNIGKNGDTALMILLRNKKIRPDKEEAKINILIKYGALWTTPNKKGATADSLLKEKHPECVVKFRK